MGERPPRPPHPGIQPDSSPSQVPCCSAEAEISSPREGWGFRENNGFVHFLRTCLVSGQGGLGRLPLEPLTACESVSWLGLHGCSVASPGWAGAVRGPAPSPGLPAGGEASQPSWALHVRAGQGSARRGREGDGEDRGPPNPARMLPAPKRGLRQACLRATEDYALKGELPAQGSTGWGSRPRQPHSDSTPRPDKGPEVWNARPPPAACQASGSSGRAPSWVTRVDWGQGRGPDRDVRAHRGHHTPVFKHQGLGP